MNFDNYQMQAKVTDIYPIESALICHSLGLASEAGEVAGKIKKVIRDNNGKFTPEYKIAIAYELGDVLWYLSRLAEDIGFSLDNIATMNITKLSSRKERNQLGGSGDHR